MRLEFHEVLVDVLDRHDLKPSELAQLIRDKDSMVPKWLRGERVPQVEDLDLIVSAVEPSAAEEKELQAARRYSALKELLKRPKLGLSQGAVEQQLRNHRNDQTEPQPGNQKAESDLELEGLVSTRQGAGTFVQDVAPERRQRERLTQAQRLVRDLMAHAGSLGIIAHAIDNALGSTLIDVVLARENLQPWRVNIKNEIALPMGLISSKEIP